MLKKLFCSFILIIQPALMFAQLPLQQEAFTSCHCPGMAKIGRGTIYFSFGYNLDWFTRSDIHFKDFKTDNYNFTLYDVKGVDRPALKYIFQQDITLPQYSYRIGYFFNDKRDMGIEINYDHVKYVMLNDQRVHIKGQIHEVYFDTDTVLDDSFIRYEHTNGANYFMINGVKRLNLLHSRGELHWLSTVLRTGAGLVVPRSDTYLWGNHRNDTYHVAGYVIGVDVGLRYDFLKNFYFETSGKGAYANYTHVYLFKEGRARQHWFSFEYIFTLGFQFGAKLF
ncbi:MAG TPA: hypothetical protein VJY62_20680 [Bacteroidia bacterium]|nr:hypothetical protein [Bacteroidia bacterium]